MFGNFHNEHFTKGVVKDFLEQNKYPKCKVRMARRNKEVQVNTLLNPDVIFIF